MRKDSIIHGKTADGHDITLDGYKVESFWFHEGIITIVFKSGQTVQVLDGDEKISSVFDDLIELEYMSLISVPKTYRLILFECMDIHPAYFNSNAVEFLISKQDHISHKEYVELHFDSGKTITLLVEAQDAGYWVPAEDKIENVVDDYAVRHKDLFIK